MGEWDKNISFEYAHVGNYIIYKYFTIINQKYNNGKMRKL